MLIFAKIYISKKKNALLHLYSFDYWCLSTQSVGLMSGKRRSAYVMLVPAKRFFTSWKCPLLKEAEHCKVAELKPGIIIFFPEICAHQWSSILPLSHLEICSYRVVISNSSNLQLQEYKFVNKVHSNDVMLWIDLPH